MTEPQRLTFPQTPNTDSKVRGADLSNDYKTIQKNQTTAEAPPSLMARKFLNSGGQIWQPDPNHDNNAFRKEYYLFYDTLMDPKTLAQVLRLPIRPKCHPAKIIGYSCKLWGSYPALVDNPPGAIVHGVAYEVQSSEEVGYLHAYETDSYRPRGCLIEFEDGREVAGKGSR